MNFSEALNAIKEGRKVRRNCWYEKTFINLIKGHVLGQAIGEYYGDGETPLLISDQIAMHTFGGNIHFWTPRGEDYLANDWSVID